MRNPNIEGRYDLLIKGKLKMQSKNGCPFCQDKVIEVVKSIPPAAPGFQVECDNCGARGPISSKEGAIVEWEALSEKLKKQ